MTQIVRFAVSSDESLTMRASQLPSALVTLLLVSAAVSADNVRLSFLGKNSCAPEFKLATTRYGIRLDSSQNAYLKTYRLKAANIAFGNLIWPHRGRLIWPHPHNKDAFPLAC